MKRIFGLILVVLFCSIDISAVDYYQSFRNGLVGIGDFIEKTDNVPVVNRLTNLLPFAVLATSFKECPIQTMMVLAGLLAYVASHNELIRSKLSEYMAMSRSWLQGDKGRAIYIDDSLFIFDGEDAEDAEEDSLTEDSLLFDEDGNDDDMRTAKRTKKFTRNHL